MQEEARRREGAKGQGEYHPAQLEQAKGANPVETAKRASNAEPTNGAAVVSSAPSSAEAPSLDGLAEQHPTLTRLQCAIAWYDRQSARNLQASKRLRTAALVAAAMIPFFAGLGAPAAIVAGLGVVIVLLEAMQQLHQYQHLGTHYRATAEALKHEQFLFVAGARPYEGEGDVLPLLAERVEALVAQAPPTE